MIRPACRSSLHRLFTFFCYLFIFITIIFSLLHLLLFLAFFFNLLPSLLFSSSDSTWLLHRFLTRLPQANLDRHQSTHIITRTAVSIQIKHLRRHRTFKTLTAHFPISSFFRRSHNTCRKSISRLLFGSYFHSFHLLNRNFFIFEFAHFSWRDDLFLRPVFFFLVRRPVLLVNCEGVTTLSMLCCSFFWQSELRVVCLTVRALTGRWCFDLPAWPGGFSLLFSN